MQNDAILVTGCAGFIGFHLALALRKSGYQVFGIDNLNDYYSVELKRDRLRQVEAAGVRFTKLDLADRSATANYFAENRFDYVVHLAAQAGVRYSIKNPHAYVDSNLQGFLNILEGCRHNGCKHLIYASSSSVYGGNKNLPFSTRHSVDHPVSLYAATKKANELMAHSYAAMYGLASTGLRFFTVYGPWGRPDMALYTFADAILAGKAIQVYNYGKMQRDFTYVDDIVEAIVRLVPYVPVANPEWAGELSSSFVPYRVFNIGNNNPVDLMYFIELVEKNLGMKATKDLQPLQAGDVPATYADIEDLENAVGFRPSTPIEVGVNRCMEWYQAYRAQITSGV
jgi:UDP-glucuronate 4-epimerase